LPFSTFFPLLLHLPATSPYTPKHRARVTDGKTNILWSIQDFKDQQQKPRISHYFGGFLRAGTVL
jgi:hypothetical protein